EGCALLESACASEPPEECDIVVINSTEGQPIFSARAPFTHSRPALFPYTGFGDGRSCLLAIPEQDAQRWLAALSDAIRLSTVRERFLHLVAKLSENASGGTKAHRARTRRGQTRRQGPGDGVAS